MKAFLLTFFVLFSFISFSQVGIGTTNPNASSELDVTATNKGMLIPRVSLVNTNLPTPVTNPVESLLVYNTNASVLNGQGTGYYYWDGAQWVSLVSSSSTSTISPHNTLDMAYDQGGAGMGRIITADNGYVYINGTDGIRVTGLINSGSFLGATTGVQMLFYPRLGAFRSGSGTWNDPFPGGAGNVGRYSVAMGFNNTASGQFSVAMCNGASAEAESTVAIGNGARAVQQDDLALGQGAIANGKSSTAIGQSTEALGISSTAIGSSSHAIGNTSTAIGNGAQAEELNSTAIGFSVQSLGIESLAIGSGVRTDSFREFAVGSNNTNGGGNVSAWVATDRLFVVGNGDPTTTPPTTSNALVVLKNGNTGIGSDNPTSKLQVVGLPIFADNAAASAGGLTTGAFYHNGDGVVRVVY